MTARIGDFVKIHPFDPVISLAMVVRGKEIIRQYVITKEVEDNLNTVVDSFLNIKGVDNKSFLIIGAYGVGKSYFLLFSSLVADATRNDTVCSLIEDRIQKTGLSAKLTELKQQDMQLLAIRLNLKDYIRQPLDYLLVNALKEAALEQFKEEFSVIHEFKEINRILETWKVDRREDYDKFVEELKNKGVPLEKFLDLVEGYDNHSKTLFFEIHEKIMSSKPSLPVLDLRSALLEFIKFLKEKGIQGLVFFLDELSTFLEGKGDEILSELAVLESFAEFTKLEPVILLGSILRKEILSHHVDPKYWEKSKDRFKFLSLTLERLEDLMRSKVEIINPKELEITLNLLRPEYMHQMTQSRLPDVKQVYPFHPRTVDLLEKSSGLMSQTRSAFSFISEVGHQILDSPLVEDGQPFFVLPDLLYTYFKEDLRLKNSELIKVLENMIETTKDELGKKIIKTMGIASVLDQITPLSSKDLEIAFLNNRAQKVLDELRNAHSLYFMAKEEGYVITPFSSAQASPLMQKAGEILRYKFKESLLSFIKSRSSKIKKITAGSIPRNVQIEFFHEEDIDELAKVPPIEDLRFSVILPREELNTEGITRIRLKANSKDVLIMINKLNIDKEQVSTYFAAHEILNTKLRPDDVEFLRACIDNINISKQFDELLSKENVSVFWKDQQLEFKSHPFQFALSIFGLSVDEQMFDITEMFLNEIGSAIFPQIYPFLHKLNLTAIMERRHPVQDVKEEFILSKGKKRKEKTKTYIRQIMVPIGLAKEKSGYFYLSEPENGVQKEIFDKILSMIVERTQLSEVYATLSESPYGFNEILFEIYIASLVVLGRAILLKNARHFPLKSAKDINEIGKQVKKFVIAKTESIDPEKWALLRNVWKTVGHPPEDLMRSEVIRKDEQESNWEKFKKDLKDALKRVKHIQNRLEDFLGSESEIPDFFGSFLTLYSELRDLDYSVGLLQAYYKTIEFTDKKNIQEAWTTFRDIWAEIQKYETFFEEEKEEISTMVRYLRELKVPTEYEELTKLRNASNSFLENNMLTIITNIAQRQKFKDMFKDCQELYISIYEGKHKIVNSMLEDFCKDLEDNIFLRIFEVLFKIRKTLVSEPPSGILDEITSWRQRVCPADSRKELATKTRCICGQLLENFDKIESEFKTNEMMYYDQIRDDARIGLGNLVKAIPEDYAQRIIQDHGWEEGSKIGEQIDTIIRGAKNVVELIQKDDYEKNMEDVEQLANLLEVLGTQIGSLLELEGEKEPDIKSIHINELFEHIRTNIRRRKVRPADHQLILQIIKEFFETNKEKTIEL